MSYLRTLIYRLTYVNPHSKQIPAFVHNEPLNLNY